MDHARPPAPHRGAAAGPETRRWLIVAALFAVNYGMSTPLAAYGVFLPVLADEFGWSRGAISAALSLNLLVGGLAGFAVGTLADRHGPRGLLTGTAVVAGAAFALVSAVGALWHLYLLIGVVGGVGMSSFYLLTTATVTHWFHARRGLGLALVLVGFNLGYITGGPLAAWLITQLGWRAAYGVLGAGCGLLTACAAFTVHAHRASSGAIRSCVAASEQTSGRLSQNALPGLKSVARATAAPASISARAGGIGRPRKRALAGRSTPVTSLAASAATPALPVASRWSTERAPSSIASGIAPDSVNWSPCSRSARPASRQAVR